MWSGELGRGQVDTAPAPSPGLGEGPLGHRQALVPKRPGRWLGCISKPTRRCTFHARSQGPVVDSVELSCPPLLSGIKPQTPWFPKTWMHSHITGQHARNTDPRACPGMLRTGSQGCCIKEGPGTPPWKPQGPHQARNSYHLMGHKLLVSRPCPNSSPRGHRYLIYCSLSFLICRRRIIRGPAPRSCHEIVIHSTNIY